MILVFGYKTDSWLVRGRYKKSGIYNGTKLIHGWYEHWYLGAVMYEGSVALKKLVSRKCCIEVTSIDSNGHWQLEHPKGVSTTAIPHFRRTNGKLQKPGRIRFPISEIGFSSSCVCKLNILPNL